MPPDKEVARIVFFTDERGIGGKRSSGANSTVRFLSADVRFCLTHIRTVRGKMQERRA
jgi:hypothetical protein